MKMVLSMARRGGTVLRLLLLLALAGVVAAVILNQRAVGRLRLENQELEGARQEAERLASENSAIPQLREAGREAERLRREVQSLPGLRNEARQLRRQAEEVGKLRSENERLATEQKASGAAAGRAPMPADFIARAALGDAGLGTPEATALTVTWAMCQGNLDRLAQCSLDGSSGFNGDLDVERQRMVEQMRDFPGFRIAERKNVSDHEVVLGLQASPGGSIVPMKLARVGNEWKVLR